MPIYPPRNEPTRKIEVLEKREMELEKCIRTKASTEKTENKAEKLRTAQLNLIKARLALITSFKEEDNSQNNKQLRNKLEKEFKNWKTKSIQKIISDYEE